MPSPLFPTEILLAIFALVHLADPHDVAACALVSRHWNACSTDFLYGDLHVVWLSRRGKNLLRTLRGDPSLARLVRSVSVTYPTLAKRADLPRLRRRVFEQRWEGWFDALPVEEQRRIEEGEAEEDRGRRGEHEEAPLHRQEINKAALALAMAELEAEGNADWMSTGHPGFGGDGPRIEGAEALMSLLALLPLLRRLSLSDVEHASETIIVPYLPNLLHLTLKDCNTLGGISSLLPALLAGTPALGSLSFTNSSNGAIPSILFLASTALHTLSIEAEWPGPLLLSLPPLVAPTLRHLHLRAPIHAPAYDPVIPSLLHTLPHLQTLTWSGAGIEAARAPFPLHLLDALSRATELRTLGLPYTLSASLWDFLPAGVVEYTFLGERETGREPLWPAEVLNSLVAKRRRGGMTALERFGVEGMGEEGGGYEYGGAVRELGRMGVELKWGGGAAASEAG